jgi:tetratricopeptide (TPR) repeat protein
VLAVAFSPDGKTVLTSSDDKTARLWDAASGQPCGEPLRHEGSVRAVAFSPDGKTVLTGSDDKTARRWDVVSGQPRGEPLRHESSVYAVAFSPDGKTMLTAPGDKTAQLWDVVSGQPRGEPLRHDGPVMAVAFSPDGKTVLTGSWYKTGQLWDIDPGPIPDREESLARWVAVRTCLSRTADGLIVPLLAPDRLAQWHQLETTAPATLKNQARWRDERAVSWHRLQAAEAERQGQWFAVVFHLTHEINKTPADADLRRRRGIAYHELQEWDKALADFAEAVRLKPENAKHWCRRGLAFLAKGDATGYRQTCAQMLEHFAKTNDADKANDVAWLGVLLPDAVTDTKELVRLAQKAVDSKPKEWRYSETLGAALYRVGRHAQAVEQLKEAVTLEGEGGSAWVHYFLAMTHHQMKDVDEAKKWLASAIAKESAGKNPSWQDRVRWSVLRRQAQEMIEGKN